jgi:flagellar biosynthesis/type III secretory pathway protein FliH
MSRTFTIQLKEPIASVKLLDAAAQDSSTTSAEAKQTELLEPKKEGLTLTLQALNDAVNRLNQFRENTLKEQNEQIAKLAVEIARKILRQKISEGDYQIEAIVQEALKNAPTRQDVVVHLNPEDLVQCQKVQEDDPRSSLTGIKFVADTSIGRAECLLDTPKGIIESFINEHIEKVAEALKKVE